MKKQMMLACAVALAAGMAGAAKPYPYGHFDLGVGKYSTGWEWGGGEVLDTARYDWALVQFTNEPVSMKTPERINQALALNPKLKIMVRLWPKPGFVRKTKNPNKQRTYIGFLDYLYYPEAKEAFLKEALAHLHLITDNVTHPENVYGCTLFEELPHQFGYDVGILSKTTPEGADIAYFKEYFGDRYKAETGKEMTEWNRDLRIWWGKKFAEALRDVAHEIKKDSPKIHVFVWFMSHFRLLDWLEPGEDVHTPKVIPCYWKDIICPDGADGFFAYNNNAYWAERYQKLAKDNHWPYFSQLSHPGQMRIASWDECVKIAKADLPENLGYFYYGPDFTYGHWNDDPDVRPDEVSSLSGLFPRMRRYLAKADVGMDIVRRNLAPQVVLSHELGDIALKNFGMATAVVTNRRTEEWFATAEEATLRNVKVALSVPKEFSVPQNVSAGECVTIPVLKPGETKTVMWWVRRDRETAKDAKLPVSVTAEAEGVAPVTVSAVEPVSNPVPYTSFDVKRSGDAFVYVNWGLPWSKRMPEVTLECRSAMMQNPRIRVDTHQITYQGILKPGEKLVIRSALVADLVQGRKHTDVSGRLLGEELGVGKGVTKIEYFDDYPTGGSMKARLSIRFPDLMEYDPELRDRCWMWGHDSGVYDGTNNVYNIPVSPTISMCDAIRYMGIPNVCAVRWFPATKDRRYLEDFRKAKRFSWVACGDSRWATKYELAQGCLDAMREYPNMTGMDYDDFFQGGTNVLQECSEGKIEAEAACFTLKEMEDYREKLAKLGRAKRPETRLVLYAKQLKPSIRPALERVDTILFWTWDGKDLTSLEKNIAKLREIAPTQKILLGIYMWDFGGRKPIEMTYMRHQLNVAQKLFRNGTIEGLIFHCTPLVNKNLEAVEYCKSWLEQHGHETQQKK